jgi:hypothetical protein
VSAVAHFLEKEGVPTTGISLVREHTAEMRPPRALWVSFELGRPFGAPHEPGLQTRTLRAALALLERGDGPAVLEDFPEDAPKAAATEDAMEGMACPVPLPRPKPEDRSGPVAAVEAEVAALAPWYALAVERSGRSTVGVSGLDLKDALGFLGALLAGDSPTPAPGMSLAQTLRFATEDLRNWYLEAASARPGGSLPATAMADWFWGETAAGALVFALRAICIQSTDAALRHLATRALVPRTQMHRVATASG